MDMDLVRGTRASSRKMVRELGFLRPGAAICGVPFAQCHTLIELEEKGTLTIGQLAQILKVDKSAVSRTIDEMVKEKLVEVRPDKTDPRKKPIGLTPLGRNQVQMLHEKANADVVEALSLLTEEEQKQVVTGLSLYAKALSRANQQKGFEIRRVKKSDNPYLATIFRTVMPEFGATSKGFAIHDSEVDDMYSNYTSGRTAYFVVEKDGKVCGGGGVARLEGADRETCELRKMYFLPETRGFGLGRKVLELCLAEAKALGFKYCYLETLDRMHQARRLYESFGFKPLKKPMGNTGHFGCDSWYGREL